MKNIDMAAKLEKMAADLETEGLSNTATELRTLARATPQHIPRNFTTHRAAWRDALTFARDASMGDGAAYWQHELDAYDRSFARLLDNPEPVRDAATPQHSVSGQDEPLGRRVTYVPSRGKKGVVQVTAWGPADMTIPPHRRIIEDLPMYAHAQPLASTAATQPEQASECELLSSAIQRASVLAKVGMEFGAKLCIIESTTIKGKDYIRRDSVMSEVAAWRTAFDNAPKVDSAAARAALAIPASTAPARDAEGN